MRLLQQNNYKIYKHIFPNEKVYIGLTKQRLCERWRNGKGYYGSTRIHNAIQKYGWENVKHEVLFENLTKEDAERKEIELIEFYKSYDENYGYNLEKGGNANKEVSEETKEKLRKKLSGTGNGMYGKKHKIETIEMYRQTRSGKGNPMYGKKGVNHPKHGKHLTDEQKEKFKKIMNSPEVNKKISDGLKGDRNPMKNKVYAMKAGATHKKKVICVETGIVYDSISEASNDTNIKSGRIIDTCRGRQKTAGGYHWEYYKDKTI